MEMDSNWVGWIPANPEIVSDESSKALREIHAANTTTRVEPTTRVVIPLPPQAVQVEIKPPERRKFIQPPAASRDEVFRSRR